jgi:hypothetical protein
MPSWIILEKSFNNTDKLVLRGNKLGEEFFLFWQPTSGESKNSSVNANSLQELIDHIVKFLPVAFTPDTLRELEESMDNKLRSIQSR